MNSDVEADSYLSQQNNNNRNAQTFRITISSEPDVNGTSLHKVTLILNSNDYAKLIEKSDHFRNIYMTLDPASSDSFQFDLVDNHPICAAEYLLTLITSNNKPVFLNDERLFLDWNKSFAILSSKWSVQNDIDRYNNMIEDFTNRLFSSTSISVTSSPESFTEIRNEIFSKELKSSRFVSITNPSNYIEALISKNSSSWDFYYSGKCYYCNKSVPIMRPTSPSFLPPSDHSWIPWVPQCNNLLILQIVPYRDERRSIDLNDKYYANLFMDMIELGLKYPCYAKHVLDENAPVGEVDDSDMYYDYNEPDA
jgi:hypothetical protein